MSEKSFPERLFDAGYLDLVSVIPPGAQLVPSSKISQKLCGKIPGRRHPSGLWAGYDWRKHVATIEDVQQWYVDGANVGLRATRFPGVDIDCTDPTLVRMIEDAVVGQLGPAPVRIGRAPKRLLLYKTDTPFSRMRLWIDTPKNGQHLVEILGDGQQYLVHGTHPSGAAYEWLSDPTTTWIPDITAEKASACLDFIQQLVELAGIGTVRREGDGRRQQRATAGDQEAFLAPSLDALRAAVDVIPNANHLYPTREDYIKFGYAIRAAVGAENDEDGFEIFSEWAARWDGGLNDPEVVRDDWRRMAPPFAVGWSFIAETARRFGYDDVADHFEATEPAPDEKPAASEEAPRYSDHWLAEQVIERTRGVLRYIPQKGSWMVWDGARWAIDAELQAESTILRTLKDVALELIRRGATEAERKANYKLAMTFCSAGKATAVAQIVKASRAVAVSLTALDHDPWVLNTPGGLVDLRTGKITPSNPDALATRMTAVPPVDGEAPEWMRFITEACGGDEELIRFLQHYAGYCLTGSTEEQKMIFVFGPGQNGKSLIQTVFSDILGDYAASATMDTFSAGASDKHSTDLAMLMGARLVTASETSAGKRLDDQRIKMLTGGDKISARFMRQDNFTFKPQFKLFFVGNHQPELRDVDKAMRRRILMVPFVVTPKVVDMQLAEKLKAEWPAILAWMITGCREWQFDGLQPPECVTAATRDYFEREDAYGSWLEECVEVDPTGRASTAELFQSWQEWANPRGEFVANTKRLASALIARGWPRWRDPKTRRMGFEGYRVIQRQGGDLSVF